MQMRRSGPSDGSAKRKKRGGNARPESATAWRLDAAGMGFLALVLAAALAAVSGFAAPANAGKDGAPASEKNPSLKLDKKFKGKLPITELTEDEAALHALNRLGYGPRPGDVQRVEQMGLEKWIDQQLDPDSIDDAALDERMQKYPTLAMSSQQLLDQFPPPALAAKQAGETKQDYKQQMQEKRRDAMADVAQMGNDNIDKAQEALAKIQGPGRIVAELSMAKIDRAVYSNRQLEAVMEDFWFNHFNVFAGKGPERWMLTSYVRDTIRPNTMGKFQDLLTATAKSPAMLFFLDNWLSVDPAAFKEHQQEIAERRARFQGAFGGGFRPFGTPQQQGAEVNAQQQRPKQQEDRGLNENYGREVMELHTVGVDAGYTQQDVIEMAECLTGWTVREPRRDPEFVFKPEFHAAGKKVVMGHTFDYGGEKDGEEALAMLANDPHTAKFISTELARHFVSDTPPPALVARMTKTYESTGGDIRSVLKTMIYSPEFWSKETYRAKVKTPFELVASTARALDADVSVSLPLAVWVGRMGEPLFLCQPPTGYSDKASTWVNTGALLNRLNFALGFATDRMAGANVDLADLFGEDASKDPQMALTRATDLFLDGQLAPTTMQTLEARLNDPQILQARLDDPVKQVNEGLLSGLVLGTPEFQRR
ncbi:MAG TPA: DUF1800 domain-containing protein [Candidatus Acidoferrales bacterium]|jgi:uncharacterized protein (DUF1800 family)|nr:DUF1800 domain-containing protein [Candidatus Acidoferrales bacterium]